MRVQVREAAERLARGELVALPTETVYGLAARADDDAAVQRIFSTKGRPADHPLIVHVRGVDQARAFASQWPASAQTLAQQGWPGPLTLVLPRRADQAQAAAAGHATVALRCPQHPDFQAVLLEAERLGVPGLAAPSANRFGRVSPTRVNHVEDEFGTQLPVLDGGDCAVGIESTIVDCSRDAPVLLRPGHVSSETLSTWLGQPLGLRDAAAPRVSGDLVAHYAPNARLRLLTPDALRQALATGQRPPGLAVYCFAPCTAPDTRWVEMPTDPVRAAQGLFAVLRQLDAEGVQDIWVETPPEFDPRWAGVLDRLRRAAAAHS